LLEIGEQRVRRGEVDRDVGVCPFFPPLVDTPDDLESLACGELFDHPPHLAVADEEQPHSSRLLESHVHHSTNRLAFITRWG
jgi:hypothetical protein